MDRPAFKGLESLLTDRDPSVRREASIALGKLGDRQAIEPLLAALGDSDRFAAWSIRHAIRRLGFPSREALLIALFDPKRREEALILADESWSVPVVQALVEAHEANRGAGNPCAIVANLAGQYRKYPGWTGEWYGPNPLAGPFPQKTEPWSAAGMTTVLEGLRIGLADRDPSVRFPSIIALGQVGPPAAKILRTAFPSEPDVHNQESLVEALGMMNDSASVHLLTTVVVAPERSEPVRAAGTRRPRALSWTRRLACSADRAIRPRAPDSLIARALPPLARDGIVPTNDVAGFLEHASPTIRTAALLSLNVKKALPSEIKDLVLARLDDKDPEVRRSTIMAAAALSLRGAVPRLIEVASGSDEDLRPQAIAALCLMPDSRAAAIYRQAAQDPDPSLQRAGQRALTALGDHADPSLIRASTESGRPGTTVPNPAARLEELRRFALGHPGDPRKGEELFFKNKSIGCARCHPAGGRSKTRVGPDLSGITLKYDKAEMIRSVLEPSNRIASGY